MPLDDYWFNEPQFISCKQQEFYAQGIVADACWVQPYPGYTVNCQLLQLPANPELNRVYWGYADDNSNFATGKFVTTDGPENVFLPPNVQRNGFTQTAMWNWGYQYPTYVEANAINGGFALTESGLFTTIQALGPPENPRWFGSSSEMMVTQLDFLVQLTRMATLNRAPGDFAAFPFINTGFLIELPAMFLLRTSMVSEPDNPDQLIGLPKYYRAGYIAWGHK